MLKWVYTLNTHWHSRKNHTGNMRGIRTNLTGIKELLWPHFTLTIKKKTKLFSMCKILWQIFSTKNTKEQCTGYIWGALVTDKWSLIHIHEDLSSSCSHLFLFAVFIHTATRWCTLLGWKCSYCVLPPFLTTKQGGLGNQNQFSVFGVWYWLKVAPQSVTPFPTPL